METTKMKGLAKDQRGAVLAEFVVAIFPMLTIFFVFVQLSMLAVSSLIVKHSAVVGARAAAVFSNEHQNVPEQCNDDGAGKIDAAVRAALGPWSNRITTSVSVRDQSSRSEEDGVYDLVTVTVNAQVRCAVPVGKIICGTSFTKQIVDVKSMPHQGARYRTRQCSGGASGSGSGSASAGASGSANGAFQGRGGRSGGAGATGTFQGNGGSFGGAGASGSWP